MNAKKYNYLSDYIFAGSEPLITDNIEAIYDGACLIFEMKYEDGEEITLSDFEDYYEQYLSK